MYTSLQGVKTKLYDVLGTMFEINDIGFRRSSKVESAQLFTSAKAFIFIVDLTHFGQTVQGEKKRKNKMVGVFTFSVFYVSSMLQTSCKLLLYRDAVYE